MDEAKQTSKQWYKYYSRTVGLIIANFEGWGKDLKQSFEKDLVTHDEFLDMLKKKHVYQKRMKYIVMRTNLRTLISDYYIGGGGFLLDASFAKTYNTKEECPYSDKPVVESKAFNGEVLDKYFYNTVVEK